MSPRVHGRYHPICQGFAGRTVALRATAQDGLWTVFFSRFPIAQIDLRIPPA